MHTVLIGKSERKRAFGRLRHRWEDNMRMRRCGLDLSGLG
jgi:hypothetical protein